MNGKGTTLTEEQTRGIINGIIGEGLDSYTAGVLETACFKAIMDEPDVVVISDYTRGFLAGRAFYGKGGVGK